MKLFESEGKEIFRKYNIEVPNSFLIKKSEEIEEIPSGTYVIKSQMLAGSRKKQGLVKFAKKSKVGKAVKQLLKYGPVLVEEKLEYKKEAYISLAIDRLKKDVMVIFSEQGGIDIETISKKHPGKILKLGLNELEKNLKDEKELLELIKKLKQVMYDYDAELVEINPLVWVNNKFVALDSKIILDDNALFRHKDYEEIRHRGHSDVERKASENGLHYVELDGNIGVIGCGAGLVMATLDMLKLNKLKPANFLDVGGGASTEKMSLALELVTKKDIKAIFINIFGGITRCDEIAEAIVNFEGEIPLVVRMTGTNEGLGKAILRKNNIPSVDSIEEGIEKLKCL